MKRAPTATSSASTQRAQQPQPRPSRSSLTLAQHTSHSILTAEKGPAAGRKFSAGDDRQRDDELLAPAAAVGRGELAAGFLGDDLDGAELEAVAGRDVLAGADDLDPRCVVDRAFADGELDARRIVGDVEREADQDVLELGCGAARGGVGGRR